MPWGDHDPELGPIPLAPEADALTHMQHRLATQAGKAVYAQRLNRG